ncbi:MAG: hypothetical protein KAH14_03880 [Clostridiales bacterium]|nr:hypothetical protein [Clostridiales bacterium]
MNSKGYSTVETALTFPIFLLMTVVLLFVLIMFVKPSKEAKDVNKTFMERVYLTDSIKRKAEIVNDIFE